MRVGTRDLYAEKDMDIRYDEENDIVEISWTTPGGTFNRYEFGSQACGLEEFIAALKEYYQEELETAIQELEAVEHRLLSRIGV